ncbi:MAG TPA: phosphoribosylformylglycinamidine cyclo-ligase [Elusimicrobiota bacterium]|nr:phosphoribosylformylglycinamidine cyclo-ligase [Elusimicrobiota bacterium]
MSGFSYRAAGVDTAAGDAVAAYAAKRAPAIGGFAGLFPLELAGPGPYDLVACTDGVGTKLKIAFALNRHHTIGIDLVAMCVNDLITCGAKPLFFLDYYASGKIEPAKSRRILDGIFEGCRQGKLALLGGETAEMPGFYAGGEYDLAGFCVGLVARAEKIDGTKIRPDDVILALKSSGLHSNGFSLARRVFSGAQLKRRGASLLTPTRIYVSQIERLRRGLRAQGADILGVAHITGGGLVENLPRILPQGVGAAVRKKDCRTPKIFREIQRLGGVKELEMWRTFNMGVGMAVVVRPQAAALARKILPELYPIGGIVRGKNEVTLA